MLVAGPIGGAIFYTQSGSYGQMQLFYGVILLASNLAFAHGQVRPSWAPDGQGLAVPAMAVTVYIFTTISR